MLLIAHMSEVSELGGYSVHPDAHSATFLLLKEIIVPSWKWRL